MLYDAKKNPLKVGEKIPITGKIIPEKGKPSPVSKSREKPQKRKSGRVINQVVVIH